MSHISPEWLLALAALITALSGAYISLKRELRRVKHLVNSQLERVMVRLDIALKERDEARTQRDERDE